MSDISNYEKIKEDAYNFYKKLGRVRCPALNNEFVHFNAEGFNHLIYRKERRERKKESQIMKFKLLPKEKYLIDLTTTHQEFDESITEVIKKRRKKKVRETAIVKYWGIVAIIRDFRIKVIIRQIGNGQKHFWSVIPGWTINHYKKIRLIRKAKGNLEED